MGRRGGNLGRQSAKSGESAAQNRKNEAVHRDPDIGGIFRRFSHGPHMRERRTEFVLFPFLRRKRR
jgi:hypothetical protein